MKKTKIDLANKAIDDLELTLPKVDSASPSEYIDAILLIKKHSVESLPGNKYKIFRNFMTNELGITQEDIKEWAKQAVEERVEKYLKSLDIKDMVTTYAKTKLKDLIADYKTTQQILTDAVAEQLRRTLKVSVEIKDDK